MDLKEGPGGIRDVEFLVQALQLFWGGRRRELRTGNVLDALAALGRLELLPEEVVVQLTGAYLWLRRAEHALQMVEERQTARFPRDPAGQLALARRLGYPEHEGVQAHAAILDDWTNQRAVVRRHFEALVLETEPDARA
jgi:glutamate-ammonia-ligase adenylyltransferase